MSWKDLKGGIDYVKFEGDGAEFKGVPMGEPDVKEKADGNLTCLFNMAELGTNGAPCKVLRCGIIVANKIARLTKRGENAGKVELTLVRHGKPNDKDTTYEVKARALTAAEVKEAAACDTMDLKVIEPPETKRGRRK